MNHLLSKKTHQQIAIIPIKTKRVGIGDNLLQLIKLSLNGVLREGDLLVVTSKVVALWEKRVVKKDPTNSEQKRQLVKNEADFYLPVSKSKYNVMLTILNNNLGVNAGIDESNVVSDHYVLLPKNPYQSAEKIWRFCQQEFGLKNLGVVISDSRSAPLRWGVFGTGLSHCGFVAMHDKRGDIDLYGRKLKMTQINLVESAAQAAVFAMGEGNESQPLAIVRGVPHVHFINTPISDHDKQAMRIGMEDDIYYPLLNTADWQSQS